jgi:DNA-binding response OmpR family regulator
MGNLSLLLVDDEKALLILLKKYLERSGHLVDTCETAAEALTKCNATPCPYQLVVLDLKLPDMRGDELLPLLLDAVPGLKVLISSGTPYSPGGLKPAYRDRVDALAKPFLPSELMAALNALAVRAHSASV